MYPKLVPSAILSSKKLQLSKPSPFSFLPLKLTLFEYFHNKIKEAFQCSNASKPEPPFFIYNEDERTELIDTLKEIYEIVYRTSLIKILIWDSNFTIEKSELIEIARKVIRGCLKVLSVTVNLSETWSDLIFEAFITALSFIHYNSKGERIDTLRIVSEVYKKYYKQRPELHFFFDKEDKDLATNAFEYLSADNFKMPTAPINLDNMQFLRADITFPCVVTSPIIFDHFYPYRLKVSIFSHIPSVV